MTLLLLFILGLPCLEIPLDFCICNNIIIFTSHISLQPVSGVCWRGSALRRTGCVAPSPASVWRNACVSVAMRSVSCAKASTIAWILRDTVRAIVSSSRCPYRKWISIPVPIVVTRICSGIRITIITNGIAMRPAAAAAMFAKTAPRVRSRVIPFTSSPVAAAAPAAMDLVVPAAAAVAMEIATGTEIIIVPYHRHHTAAQLWIIIVVHPDPTIVHSPQTITAPRTLRPHPLPPMRSPHMALAPVTLATRRPAASGITLVLVQTT